MWLMFLLTFLVVIVVPVAAGVGLMMESRRPVMKILGGVLIAQTVFISLFSMWSVGASLGRYLGNRSQQQVQVGQ